MKIVKPGKLLKGDVIGIISPASSPDEYSKIEAGVNYLEKLGYRVESGKNIGKSTGYLAGTNEERLKDLHDMFRNKNVKAIFCARGGYGSPRLLDKIDYKLIAANPKIFVGYSDITALQLAFMAKTGLATFAGPMLAVDFADEISPYTEEMFWALLTSNKKFGKIIPPNDEKIFHLTTGNIKGRVIGGNLSLISSLIGTEYLPPFKDKILFLEEIGELPYRIDRMLNQLRLAGLLRKINGAILGAFVDCNETDPLKKSLTLGEVISEYFGTLDIPVVYNFKHGHLKENITVPYGIMVKLNAVNNYVEITESAVV